MASPNIVAVTAIYGTTTYLIPSDTSANVLLSNGAGSNKVFKVNQIVVANVDGTNAVNTTVTINSAAAGGGTAYPVASTISVPADASLIVTDKTTGFYLMENQSVVVTSGTASKLSYTISYEDITS